MSKTFKHQAEHEISAIKWIVWSKSPSIYIRGDRGSAFYSVSTYYNKMPCVVSNKDLVPSRKHLVLKPHKLSPMQASM